MVLVILAYYFAYVLLFGSDLGAEVWRLFLSTVPVLIFVKMTALLAAGVYRGLWRYVSLDNLIVYAKAVAAGSVASVLVLLFAFRFEGFSRAVFVLDAMFFFLMLAGSRVAFRLFRQLLPAPTCGRAPRAHLRRGRRGRAAAARDAQQPRSSSTRPSASSTTTRSRRARSSTASASSAATATSAASARNSAVEEVLISSSRIDDERIAQIRRDCEDAQITLKRMRIEIELVGHEF